jgi:hypothetical protein
MAMPMHWLLIFGTRKICSRRLGSHAQHLQIKLLFVGHGCPTYQFKIQKCYTGAARADRFCRRLTYLDKQVELVKITQTKMKLLTAFLCILIASFSIIAEPQNSSEAPVQLTNIS